MPTHRNTTSKLIDEEAASSDIKQRENAAFVNSRDLRDAIHGAIHRQARRWRIRHDQAQALLLDHKAVA